MARTGTLNRKTAETDIQVSIDLDGSGKSEIETGIGFFDHMLTLLAKHGFFDLTVKVQGDLDVDGHHTVEDTGIVIGQAICQALGGKAGIKRYGSAFVPMDEALAMVALDISGRPYLAYDVPVSAQRVGTFDTELTEEFLRALAVQGGLTIHAKLLAGKNAHHCIEAVFKALGRAISEAVTQDSRITGVLSTKGIL